jgi:hypothetical protein
VVPVRSQIAGIHISNSAGPRRALTASLGGTTLSSGRCTAPFARRAWIRVAAHAYTTGRKPVDRGCEYEIQEERVVVILTKHFTDYENGRENISQCVGVRRYVTYGTSAGIAIRVARTGQACSCRSLSHHHWYMLIGRLPGVTVPSTHCISWNTGQRFTFSP